MTLPRDSAERFRAEHGFGVAPIDDMAAAVERWPNVNVAVLAMPDWVQGMTLRDPSTGISVVAVATAKVPERQRFTLAHELGHLIFKTLHDGTADHQRTDAERAADAFAQHLLMPEGGIESVLSDRGTDRFELDEADLAALVEQFGISTGAALVQLSECEWITPAQSEQWQQASAGFLATRYGWKPHRDALIAAAMQERPPQRILSNAIAAYQQGLIPVEVVASVWTSRSVDDVRAELEENGIVPEPPPVAAIDLDDLFPPQS